MKGKPVRDVGAAISIMIRTEYGSQKQLAKALGISESYLSDMLLKRRSYSDQLLAAAGIERITEYRFISPRANPQS